jgi:DNA-binding XRE family transcriptional regulator
VGIEDRGKAMSAIQLPIVHPIAPAWNKGRIDGQKRPLLPKHVWAIRVRLEIADNIRDFALFNMAIDCKLRGCDLGQGRAGVNRVTVAEIETGRKQGSVATLRKLADALGVAVDDIAG